MQEHENLDTTAALDAVRAAYSETAKLYNGAVKPKTVSQIMHALEHADHMRAALEELGGRA